MREPGAFHVSVKMQFAVTTPVSVENQVVVLARQTGDPKDKLMIGALPKISPDMDPEEYDQLVCKAREASELLKALSHETRLMILCMLSEGEKSVSDLEKALNMPQASVSQQLARLRADRLVHTRRDGRSIYYRIADKQVSSIVGTLYDLFCAPKPSP